MNWIHYAIHGRQKLIIVPRHKDLVAPIQDFGNIHRGNPTIASRASIVHLSN